MGVTFGWSAETDPLAGMGAAEDLSALATSLRDGDWVESGLHGVSVGLGVAGAVVDPVGALAAAGAGWALEHVGPLRALLDDVAGDPTAVMADSGRLDDASHQVASVSDALRCAAVTHLRPMEGLSVEACRGFTRATARDADQFASLLQAGGIAMRVASGIVDAVRSLVRDAIAELVGMATSSAVTVALTAGIGTPIVMGHVALRAERLAFKLSGTMKAMARSFEALRLLLARADSALESLARAARARGAGLHSASTPAPSGVAPTTWAGGVADRLLSIKPTTLGLGVGVGSTATVVAGPEE